MAGLWERGVRELDRARTLVPPVCRPRFEQEYILGKYMALTWRSAARVEEFLRRRDTIREFSGSFWLRSGHRRENRRDLNRMEKIARQERALTEEALGLARRTDFLDLSLRLDMGTATAVGILTARLAQIDRLLSVEMPQWRKRALS
jgi:hypothetical protein